MRLAQHVCQACDVVDGDDDVYVWWGAEDVTVYRLYITVKFSLLRYGRIIKLSLAKYCMSKKSWPNLWSNLLYKIGQDLDRQ